MDADSEEELSVLQYARLHGLTEDYTNDPAFDQLAKSPPSVAESDDDMGLLHHQTLLDVPITASKERLSMSREAAVLLRDTITVPEAQDISAQEPNLHWYSNLKQELPILFSDNELDLLHFGNTDTPQFGELRIPFEAVDNEKDEGMGWPSYFQEAYPERWNKRLQTERLTVSAEVLRFLQTAIKDSFTDEDATQIKAASLEYSRNPAFQPLTPPLLPPSPPITPYIPSSPGNHIPLLSDDSNSTARELEAIEKRIMEEDAIAPSAKRTDSEGSDNMLLDDAKYGISSHWFTSSPLPLPSPVKRKAIDLKVEGPLTPPILTSSPEKKLKSVSFQEMIHEFIPDPPLNNSGDDRSDSPDFFRELVPLVEEFNRKLDNENLSEADTTKRVKVPQLDFSVPVPPWKEFQSKMGKNCSLGHNALQANMRFMQQMKRDHLRSDIHWRGVSALEIKLHWGPFSRKLANANTEEELEQGKLLPALLEELSVEPTDSASLVWKPEGLRILEPSDESDVELEAVDLSEDEEKDIESLIKKRKLELEERIEPTSQASSKRHHAAPTREALKSTVGEKKTKKPNIKINHTGHESDASKIEKDNSLMFGGFSASTALSKFMAVHGKEFNAHTPSKAPPETLQKTKASLPMPRRLPPSPPPVPTPDQASPPISKSIPLPALPENLLPASFIVSSTLSQQRSLFRRVMALYPDAVSIDRDFTLPHSPGHEADMALSPSTGLILTTLQQIKQTALPGQPAKSVIRDRIVQVQARYERLVVLVSQGVTTGISRTPDSRDTAALTDLMNFAEDREADVIVKYVHGGEDALAIAVVTEMARWGLPHGSEDLGDTMPLQEETQWEVFLRTLGLNSYAAQAILATLKHRQPMPAPLFSGFRPTVPTVEVFGLPAFVMMSEDERVERFQALLGGHRILRRVSRVLDSSWLCAAHGFAPRA